jgi:type I restriction system adenine methylase HsdM
MKAYNLKSIKEDFKSKGIFYTPKELALFIKSFLPNEVKEIYDPTCGGGGLLEVFDDEVIKYGQDINREQVDNAQRKLKNFIGAVGDTLKEPAFENKKFDYIVANPPFSINWEQNNDERFNVAPVLPPKSKADYAFVLHILSKLTNKGIAVIMQFPGILYRKNSEGKIRQWLIEQNYIEKIIAVPGDKFVDTKIATCIIVLNKNKKHTDVLFIDDNLKKEKIVKFEEIKNNDFNLSVNQYIQHDKVEVKINPIELQRQARQSFITKLKAELEFDKQVCDFEKICFKEYLEEIKEVIIYFERNR